VTPHLIGCGIYVTVEGLNPPFGQEIDMFTLRFSGNNFDPDTKAIFSFFLGYIIWYKENIEDNYSICEYKGRINKPTLPRIDEVEPGFFEPNVDFIDNRGDGENPRINYTVQIADLKPLNSNKSFIDLNNEKNAEFYFAVSAYGEDDRESQIIEFGKWP
jgi:hypothetical protein